jgi:hypothetical protein
MNLLDIIEFYHYNHCTRCGCSWWNVCSRSSELNGKWNQVSHWISYLLLEFTSKTICATVPPCKAVPVEGKSVPVNGIQSYRGVDVQVHSFLTPGLKGIKWSVSCLGHFTHVDNPPTHCIELICLASPRAGLNVRLSLTGQESNHNSSTSDLVPIFTSLSQLLQSLHIEVLYFITNSLFNNDISSSAKQHNHNLRKTEKNYKILYNFINLFLGFKY